MNEEISVSALLGEYLIPALTCLGREQGCIRFVSTDGHGTVSARTKGSGTDAIIEEGDELDLAKAAQWLEIHSETGPAFSYPGEPPLYALHGMYLGCGVAGKLALSEHRFDTLGLEPFEFTPTESAAIMQLAAGGDKGVLALLRGPLGAELESLTLALAPFLARAEAAANDTASITQLCDEAVATGLGVRGSGRMLSLFSTHVVAGAIASLLLTACGASSQQRVGTVATHVLNAHMEAFKAPLRQNQTEIKINDEKLRAIFSAFIADAGRHGRHKEELLEGISIELGWWSIAERDKLLGPAGVMTGGVCIIEGEFNGSLLRRRKVLVLPEIEGAFGEQAFVAMVYHELSHCLMHEGHAHEGEHSLMAPVLMEESFLKKNWDHLVGELFTRTSADMNPSGDVILPYPGSSLLDLPKR